ncbi:MAG: hypothetical protein ACMVY4_14680 [Minwuia sp.]|uniref:hypothetical protein n=1 Tax=Minwuia sp. TaxID=2493630 RepID=UPI003A8633E8
MRPILLLALMLSCPAAAQTIVVDDGRCRLVSAHVAAPDVAYKPGVDVNGKAVVPADLNGGNAVRTPRFVPIPLNIPIAEFLAVRPPFLDQVEVDAGLVLVDVETGYLTYDGQRLDQPQFLLCEEDGNGGIVVLNLPPPPPPRPND